MIACMVGFVLQLSLVVSGFIPTEKRLVSEIPLVSIKDRNGFEGSFYILGGSIGDTSYYQYYYMTQGGGYKRGKINADYSDVTIIETDDGKPTIKIYKTSLEKSYECWFIPLDNPKAYVFTIPKGSIKKESKLE